jgi:thiol:disulfide interchange protein DsbA
MKKSVLIALFLFCFTSMVQAEDYKEGTHYSRVTPQSTSSGDKVEVLEFFWYGCPHCNVFDPILEKWVKSKPDNTVFNRVPAVFRPEWKVHARAYYALEIMGVIDKYHSKIFKAIHKDKKRLDRLDSITDFLVAQGINKEEFLGTYNSFSVDNMVRKAIKQLQGYKITGVPAMAVNGKYLISGQQAGSYENMIRIVNYLVKKETAAKK